MGKAAKLCAKRPIFKSRADYDPKVHGVCAEPLVLIIAPTRELVIQIHQEALKFCYRSKLLPCVIYGGHPEEDQRNELRRGCDILISTPGRLCHFMLKPEVLSLARVRWVISSALCSCRFLIDRIVTLSLTKPTKC
jgi:ATP-dependent RNA helicase DDX3X